MKSPDLSHRQVRGFEWVASGNIYIDSSGNLLTTGAIQITDSLTFGDLKLDTYYYIIRGTETVSDSTVTLTRFYLYDCEWSQDGYAMYEWCIEECTIAFNSTTSTITTTSTSDGELTAYVTSYETPANDPIGVTITKESSSDLAAEYIQSLAGAEFTITFYGGYYTLDEIEAGKPEADGVEKRVWVIVTQEYDLDGTIIYRAYLSEKYLDKDHSDSLFYDSDGFAVVPCGTITIEETAAPYGYSTEGTISSDGDLLSDTNGIVLLQVLEDGTIENGAALEYTNITVVDEYISTRLTLHKTCEDGHDLSGVSYLLQIWNESGQCWDDYDTQETDSEGMVYFTDLVFGDYRVTELGPVYCDTCGTSLSLLAEPIDLTLPLTLTDAEVVERGIDTEAIACEYLASEGVWHIYELNYEIINSPTLKLPMTGESSHYEYAVMTAVLLATAVFGIRIAMKRKRYTMQ